MEGRGIALVIIVAVAGVVILAFAAVNLAYPSPRTSQPPPVTPPVTPPEDSPCKGTQGLCLETRVTRVLDGDTLDVEGGYRIRLVLVDAPELAESGGPEAHDYLTSLCLGKTALVDEDDLQIGDDPYGRVLAVVICAGVHANAAMISSGHADTFYEFCSSSEFRTEAWTGCSAPPPGGGCDPAYPDFCIPPPPPDLDCSDIPQRGFRVLAPDPHRLDGDGDGIGCE